MAIPAITGGVACIGGYTPIFGVAATRMGSRKDVVVTALWGDSSLTLDTTVIRLAVTNTDKKEKRAVL